MRKSIVLALLGFAPVANAVVVDNGSGMIIIEISYDSGAITDDEAQAILDSVQAFPVGDVSSLFADAVRTDVVEVSRVNEDGTIDVLAGGDEVAIPGFGTFIPGFGTFIPGFGTFIPGFGTFVEPDPVQIPGFGTFIPGFGTFVEPGPDTVQIPGFGTFGVIAPVIGSDPFEVRDGTVFVEVVSTVDDDGIVEISTTWTDAQDGELGTIVLGE